MSIVFINIEAAKAFEPTHLKMKMSEDTHKKHLGAQYGLMEATDCLNRCLVISKQTQKLREVCVQVDEGKKETLETGTGKFNLIVI